MKFFENVAKKVFNKEGIKILEGHVAYSPEESIAICSEMGVPVVLKAQVLTGGRGKAGGVKFADNPGEALKVSEEILGMEIKGEEVKHLLIEEKADILQEYFLSISIDRSARRPVIMVSKEDRMRRLAFAKYLIETEELKMFLNKNIQNSDDFQVEIKKLKPYTLKEISDNYSKYFEEYKDNQKEKFNDEQINTCINFINNFNLKLNEYKENLVEFGEVKKTKIFRESRIASIFTDFEKYCVMEYVNNDISSLFFFNDSSSLFENKTKYKKLINNPYLILSCWLRLKELELISIKNNINEFKSLLAKKNFDRK